MRFTNLALTDGVIEYAANVGLIKQNGPYFCFNEETFIGKMKLKKALENREDLKNILIQEVISFIQYQQSLNDELPLLERIKIEHDMAELGGKWICDSCGKIGRG